MSIAEYNRLFSRVWLRYIAAGHLDKADRLDSWFPVRL